MLEIEEQGLVREKDYRKLSSLYKGHIMLYMKKAQPIMDNLIAIGRCVGMGNENSRLRQELRTPVLAIINILMQDMGFGEELNETIINEMEKCEDEFYPRLFKQAIKEALDNVLVNYNDYPLLNRCEFIQEKDGEYIIFSFINDHPQGCKILIGPFTKEVNAEIIFQLYVPRYIQTSVPQLAANAAGMEITGFADICIDGREIPLSISMPLRDSCLIELEQEDCYNGYIPSFSFNDKESIAAFRRNYTEAAFAVGQRAKYIFLQARVSLEGMHLYEYISRLENIDPFSLYPCTPWKLDENGDMIF